MKRSKFSTFLLIWSSQSLSLFGSGLSGFALAVWIYQETGSSTKLSLIYFVSALPAILVGPFGGVLIDRLNRRWTMILSDTGAGLPILILALLLWQENAEFWQLLAFLFVAGAAGCLQGPTLSAITPMLVSAHQLNRANGMVQLGNALATLLAPLSGGFLVGFMAIHGVLLVDVVTFLLAVSVMLIVRIPRVDGASLDKSEASSSIGRDILRGLRYIRDRPGLTGLLGISLGVNFCMGVVQVMITPLVLSFADSTVLGLILSSAGLGMVAGGLLMSLWGGPRRRITWILGSMALAGSMLILASLEPDPWLIGSAAFVFMACFPIIGSCSISLWQSKVENSIQGRVLSMRKVLASFAISVAYLGSGPVIDGAFEPFMRSETALSQWAATLLGTGEGRGIALLFAVLGGGLVLATLISGTFRPLREIDEDMPDLGIEPSMASKEGMSV